MKKNILMVHVLVLFIIFASGCDSPAVDEEITEQVELIDEYILMVQCSETGKLIEDAVVSWGGERRMTGQGGTISFQNIEAGTYRVEITAEGFIDYSCDNIVISIDHTRDRVLLDPFSRYRILYHFTSRAGQIWSPVPVYWDGYGTVDLELLEIKPEPSSLYTDKHGNLVAYWHNSPGVSRKYSIEYIIEVSKIKHELSGYSTGFDQNSEVYQNYTAAERYTQSDDPKIIGLAEEINAGEVDPVEKVKNIAAWVYNNIESGDAPYGWLPDALSVLQYKKGHCGAYAKMFVALCRAAGIPARNVSVFHNPFGHEFQSGMHSETYYGHIIAEFYLEDYGGSR